MNSILDVFKKNIFNSDLPIDTTKVVSKYHLRAIIHNEFIGNNNHSRIEYLSGSEPEIKKINNDVWLFMPTNRVYKYDSFYKEHKTDPRKEIFNQYHKCWLKMEQYYNANKNQEFIIDMRSFETRGHAFIASLFPFIGDCEIPVVRSNLKEVKDKIYISNKFPYISVNEKLTSDYVNLGNARITFLIDSNTAKIKDPFFMCGMYALSQRYQIFGVDIGDLIYNQYRIETKNYPRYFESQIKAGINEVYIRIPDTQIERINIIPIPDSYKPYLN